MPVYIKRRITLQASQKKSGGDMIFQRGDRDVSFDALDDLAECGLRKLAIPVPTTDLDLMDGEQVAAGKILFIETDTDITVKLNSAGATPIDVKPVIAADSALTSKPGVLYLEGVFDHVYLSVAGTSGSANVMVAIIGA